MQPTRLKKRSQFLEIAEKGQKIVSSGLILQALKNEDPKVFQVGFTTTKKLGKAVIRNRIRRRLRALVYHNFPEHAKRGYQYVLIGRKSTFDRDFEMLGKDLRYTLKQVQ